MTILATLLSELPRQLRTVLRALDTRIAAVEGGGGAEAMWQKISSGDAGTGAYFDIPIPAGYLPNMWLVGGDITLADPADYPTLISSRDGGATFPWTTIEDIGDSGQNAAALIQYASGYTLQVVAGDASNIGSGGDANGRINLIRVYAVNWPEAVITASTFTGGRWALYGIPTP
jgi:hypothetical protein